MFTSEKVHKYSKKFRIDECEIVFVKKKITTIRITDSEISEIKQNFDKSYGVRLIHEGKISSFQTNDEGRLEKTIKKSLDTSSVLKPRKFWQSLPLSTNYANMEGVHDTKLEQISETNASDIAQTMINATLDKKIHAISGSLNIISEYFEISNSKGLALADKATYISGIINAESENGESSVSGIGQECCRTLNNFPAEKIGHDAKIMCIKSINPKKCQNDTYSIIFEPYCVGELLAFVFASNFNFKTFSEKRSCFSNNRGNKIAVESFNLVDEPHIPEGIGTKAFDDEGVRTEPNNFIENGIFKNTFSNIFDGFKENKASTGNGVRPSSHIGRSSDPVPIASPHNIRIIPGEISQENMIRDTKHGLLVGRLWYTYAVNPIKGDFSCTARSGIQIIEEGEIKSPGKPVRIIHNLSVLLQNISAIGNNQKNVLPWASIPSITPSIRVDNVKTISI